jgi:hypothetical protein
LGFPRLRRQVLGRWDFAARGHDGAPRGRTDRLVTNRHIIVTVGKNVHVRMMSPNSSERRVVLVCEIFTAH